MVGRTGGEGGGGIHSVRERARGRESKREWETDRGQRYREENGSEKERGRERGK